MATDAYEKILDLQATDLKIRQLTHQHANHDLRTLLAEAKHQAVRARDDVSLVENNVEEIAQQQRQLQHRIAELTTKREASQAKLYGGAVTAANELMALEEEVAGYQEKQDAFEDDLLERMEEADGLEAELQDKSATASAVDGRVSEVENTLHETLAEIDTKIEQERAKRVDQAAAADAGLLDRYEELAPQFEGHAVAKLVHGGCDGCHIQLSVVALDRIARLGEDTHITCEECGRLLVR